MQPIKCVITDDEPMARKGLVSYVEKIDFLTLTGVCEDAIQLNTLLKTEQPDLLLLDIEMPYLSGLDLLATLPNPPKVIITSAYEQYALRGYELDVTDYLLKPISFDRFLKAVNKVYNQIQKESVTGNMPDEFMFVKSDKQMLKVFLKDILFVEGMENYIVIYMPSDKLIVHSSMKKILESLPENMFLQTHRSYIVNKQVVEGIEGNQLLIGAHKVPVARNFKDEVFKQILTNIL
ncbi:LytR/AlgR family response regulator transcription factor [Parabacteroides bouchesdurhonensis]|uniref:LytR/AlgR family response regulator transcription factor n=1 Tax=Parabacteroides bouchesdurhonensis TaxID=1936995 RepID=UPI000E50727F|nr:LytTR family DNA-binding domain-containing protein [Parabacteroides bouchesdurhonensis]RHJ93105.1 DNA-binding response regulator [Bacteroides sp. AM07-16]